MTMSRLGIIVRTRNGAGYGREICGQLDALGVQTQLLTAPRLLQFLEDETPPADATFIHYRTTGKKYNQIAHQCADIGYRVINSPRALDISGNKLLTVQHLKQHGIPVANSVLMDKHSSHRRIREVWGDTGFVVKPVQGIGQGFYCFRSFADDPDLFRKIKHVPGDEILFQEYIDYHTIYRIILIDHQPLEHAVFMDRPTSTRWKVSVCLNEEIAHVPNPEEALLDYAQSISRACGLEIGFIDIYGTQDGYLLSEINTACNLSLHERLSGVNISRQIASYLVSNVG